MAEFTLKETLTEAHALSMMTAVLAELHGVSPNQVNCSDPELEFGSDENTCLVEIKGHRPQTITQSAFEACCNNHLSRLLGIDAEDLECRLTKGSKPSNQYIYLKIQHHDVEVLDYNPFFDRR